MSFFVVVPTPAEKVDFSARHGSILPSQIVVSPDLFRDAWQEVCPHADKYITDGILTCKSCGKPLEVLSYRD